MSKPKVLVVDDEQDIVRSVGMRLQSAGCEVISATDAVMATQLALREAPNLVILDIGMPCGNGHMIAERMRDNVKTMSIPIIFLTARTAEADREKACQAGAFAYLTKPFKSEELLAIVSQALVGLNGVYTL